jgi:hypothetical protein
MLVGEKLCAGPFSTTYKTAVEVVKTDARFPA